MAGDSIKIEVDEDARPLLGAIVRRMRNARPVLRALGQIGVDSVQENFSVQGRPAKWKPRKRPPRRGNRRGYKVLTLSGRLRNSVHYQVGGQEVRVGTNVVYAGVHNRGYSGRQTVRGHERKMTSVFGRRLRTPVIARVGAFSRRMEIPQREFLVVPEADQREMTRTAVSWLLEGRR